MESSKVQATATPPRETKGSRHGLDTTQAPLSCPKEPFRSENERFNSPINFLHKRPGYQKLSPQPMRSANDNIKWVINLFEEGSTITRAKGSPTSTSSLYQFYGRLDNAPHMLVRLVDLQNRWHEVQRFAEEHPEEFRGKNLNKTGVVTITILGSDVMIEYPQYLATCSGKLEVGPCGCCDEDIGRELEHLEAFETAKRNTDLEAQKCKTRPTAKLMF
jgi:hypothetical protein